MARLPPAMRWLTLINIAVTRHSSDINSDVHFPKKRLPKNANDSMTVVIQSAKALGSTQLLAHVQATCPHYLKLHPTFLEAIKTFLSEQA
jgi:hypothetical protein